MEIGKQLKEARLLSGFTQEYVAEKIGVTRQTISNWETERCYPDLIGVIHLSELYSLSLDELLKNDHKMISYLEESTNLVKSNRKLIYAILFNVLFIALMSVFYGVLPTHQYFMITVFSLAILGSSALLYQIVKKI